MSIERELNKPRTAFACKLAAERLSRQGYSLRDISTLLNLHEAVISEYDASFKLPNDAR